MVIVSLVKFVAAMAASLTIRLSAGSLQVLVHCVVILIFYDIVSTSGCVQTTVFVNMSLGDFNEPP